jgi:hypothetical protein
MLTISSRACTLSVAAFLLIPLGHVSAQTMIDAATQLKGLPTVNSTPGLCGDSSHVCAITADAKGRVVAQSPIPITGSGNTTLSGAVSGPSSATIQRDVKNALDLGDHSTNGIAAAITACGTTTPCSVVVPPSYPTTEAVPGFFLDPNNPLGVATTSGNVSVLDQRFGDYRMYVNPVGNQFSNIRSPIAWVFNYYNPQPANDLVIPVNVVQYSYDGGKNLANGSFIDKSTWNAISGTGASWTPGQHVTIGTSTFNYSHGDALGFANYVHCWGGFTAQMDEGCEAQDNQVLQGTVAYAGTLTGSPASRATSVTVAPTQGPHTQGAERFLIDTTAAKTIKTGTISDISGAGGTPTAVTGSGTAWPISTAIGQLGTAVSAPGSATVSPNNFSVGSLSVLSPSSLVCIADGAAFEMVYPSAVTASSFSAAFTKPHPATATISTGGLCGYLLDLAADRVTNATFPNKVQQISGTLRRAWPVISSSSATSLQLWVSGGGAYMPLPTAFDATSNNAYILYPGAEVASVQQNGGISNTLTLRANNVNWAAGDTVEEPLYPAVHFLQGNDLVEQYFPNFSLAGGGAGITYNGISQGNDTLWALTNNTPVSQYAPNGGKYSAPRGIWLNGETSYGLTFTTAPDQSSIAVGCASTGCNKEIDIVRASNASFLDSVSYDEDNKRFKLSAASKAVSYTFDATHLDLPGTLNLNQKAINGASSIVASGSATIALGASAGTQSALNNAFGTNISGTIGFTTGTATSAGTFVTVTFTAAYNNYPDCVVSQSGGTAAMPTLVGQTSPTNLSISTFTALQPSTQYKVSYVCASH